jgi:hypothetical protein
MRKKKPLFNRKSMIWKTDNILTPYIQRALLFMLAVFFLAGCARKPWTEPLAGTEADSVTQLVDSLVARDAGCGETLEGDLVIFYQNPFEKKALSGFLQFSMPSSYKFVITNPIGQPVLAIAGDQISFQAINTLQRNYLAGSLRSFGLRNDIPSHFLKSDWGAWLTGRNLLSSQMITNIRKDRDSRGVWLTFKNKDQTGVHHLLLDTEKEVFPVRILEEENGRKVVEVTYNNWVSLEGCRQPLEIKITGLDYGTNIHITLSDVSLDDGRKTYLLQPPPGYSRQFMP